MLSLVNLTLVLLLPGYINAQLGFDWIWPPPFGLQEDQKSIAPCGGFSANDDLRTHFLNQLRWNQSGIDITYMSRVTQSISDIGVPSNFTELYPTIVAQLNRANAEKAQFCVPVNAPQTFDARPAIFQLIAKTPAGIIFACSRVSFQSNSTTTFAQTCDPNIRGNNTLTSNVSNAELLAAAALPAGARASLMPSSNSTESVLPTSGGNDNSATLTSRSGLSGGAIAGIVIGSMAGAGALLIIALLLCMKKRRKPVETYDSPVLPPAKSSHISESTTSRNNSMRTDTSRAYTAELPADVPKELDARDNTYAELPGSDPEKAFRPELPADNAHVYPADIKARPEEEPISRPITRASETQQISPVSPTSTNSLRSPISPI